MVRGGSWNNNRDNARCAYCNNNNPENRNNNLGFRVVCVSHIKQSFAPASQRIGAGEMLQGIPEMPVEYGCPAEAKELWMARASPVRTASRSSGAY